MFLNPQSKLFKHGGKVEDWLRGVRNPIPVLVEIAPIGFCNASCPWCFFREKHSNGSIDKDVVLRTLGELAGMGVRAVNWTGGGEPTLHPNFNDFVIKSHELGLEQGLFTNAYLEISNSMMFKWIRISLTDKGFQPIKKPRGFFGICVNMLEDTSPMELSEWCIEAKDMGAKYFQVRPALEGHYEIQPSISIPLYLKVYETDNFKVLLTPYKFEEATLPRGYDRCYGYHFCPSIDWNGKVGVCLYRMEEENYVFGNLKEKTFTEIWCHKDPPLNLIDEKCQNCCKNHEINKALFEATRVEHENFL